MVTILAFDISSKSTGYAGFSNGELQKDSIGLIELDQVTHGEKLIIFECIVRELLQKYEPEHVIVEEIWKGPNIKTFKVLAYYHGVMQKVLFEHKKITPIMFMPTEARQVVAHKYKVNLIPKRKKGKKPPKDSKELTFDFIKKKFGLSSYIFKKDNDRTDAICLGLAFLIANEDKYGSL